MIWFGRGERIVGNGDGYGGRLDHLVYRCKARRLAEHHVGRANIEAIPSLRPDDAVKHIAAEYRLIRNLDLLTMPKGWTLVRPAWILELGKPAQPVVLPLIEPFGMRRIVKDQRNIGCLQIPACDKILKTCRISAVAADRKRVV